MCRGINFEVWIRVAPSLQLYWKPRLMLTLTILKRNLFQKWDRAIGFFLPFAATTSENRFVSCCSADPTLKKELRTGDLLSHKEEEGLMNNLRPPRPGNTGEGWGPSVPRSYHTSLTPGPDRLVIWNYSPNKSQFAWDSCIVRDDRREAVDGSSLRVWLTPP